MASRAAIPDPKFGNFLTALTATNQLTIRERRHERALEKQELRDRRYVAWMTATALFHQAEAAALLACCARISKFENAAELNERHDRAITDLITATAHFVSLPLLSDEDMRERQTAIRRWGNATRASSHDNRWSLLLPEWEAQLTGGLN